MLLSQSLKTRTDAMKLVNFVQDRFKSHGCTAFRKKPKVWENFRWTGLRSEDHLVNQLFDVCWLDDVIVHRGIQRWQRYSNLVSSHFRTGLTEDAFQPLLCCAEIVFLVGQLGANLHEFRTISHQQKLVCSQKFTLGYHLHSKSSRSEHY